MPFIYCSERIQNKISKEKRCMGWNLGDNQAQDFKDPLPVESGKDALYSFSNELQQHVWFVAWQGSLLESQCPRFLLGVDWSCRHPLSGTTKIPDSQKEKQVFSINYIVYTNSLVMENQSFWFWEWWEPFWRPASQASQRSTIPSGLSKDKSQACSVSPFQHTSESEAHSRTFPWYVSILLQASKPDEGCESTFVNEGPNPSCWQF